MNWSELLKFEICRLCPFRKGDIVMLSRIKNHDNLCVLKLQSLPKSKWEREKEKKKKERELLPPCFMSFFFFLLFCVWSRALIFEIWNCCDYDTASNLIDWFTWNFWKRSFESLPLIILFVRKCVCMYCVCRYLNFECKICRKEEIKGGQSTCGHFGFQGFIFWEFLWLRMWSIFGFCFFVVWRQRDDWPPLWTSTLCLFIWLSSFWIESWTSVCWLVMKHPLFICIETMFVGRWQCDRQWKELKEVRREWVVNILWEWLNVNIWWD